MSNVKTIVSKHPGPLPIAVKYTPTSDVKETIFFSGSIYTGDLAMTNNGFDLKVNGELVGSSTVYTGDTGGGHHATVPTMVDYDIPFVVKDGEIEPVTIELVPHCSDSWSTKEDFFNVAIFS